MIGTVTCHGKRFFVNPVGQTEKDMSRIKSTVTTTLRRVNGPRRITQRMNLEVTRQMTRPHLNYRVRRPVGNLLTG